MILPRMCHDTESIIIIKSRTNTKVTKLTLQYDSALM